MFHSPFSALTVSEYTEKLHSLENKLQRELALERDRVDQLQRRLKWQEERFAESAAALGAAGRLADQIDLKESTIRSLKDDSKFNISFLLLNINFSTCTIYTTRLLDYYLHHTHHYFLILIFFFLLLLLICLFLFHLTYFASLLITPFNLNLVSFDHLNHIHILTACFIHNFTASSLLHHHPLGDFTVLCPFHPQINCVYVLPGHQLCLMFNFPPVI